MEKIDLPVKKREGIGTRKSNALRREGVVPAIVYGHGMDPVALEVERSVFMQAMRSGGSNAVINLQLEGAKLKESTCLIKKVQHHPVSDEVSHIDFTVISMTEKIHVQVPLVAQEAEEAAGVKAGGVLDIVHHEIEIECLPTQIPESISVNIKDLEINQTIHMKDIQLPEGATCGIDPEEVMIAIHPPRVEKEAEEGEGEAQAEPEVIEKGKKEDAEGEKAESSE